MPPAVIEPEDPRRTDPGATEREDPGRRCGRAGCIEPEDPRRTEPGDTEREDPRRRSAGAGQIRGLDRPTPTTAGSGRTAHATYRQYHHFTHPHLTYLPSSPHAEVGADPFRDARSLTWGVARGPEPWGRRRRSRHIPAGPSRAPARRSHGQRASAPCNGRPRTATKEPTRPSRSEPSASEAVRHPASAGSVQREAEDSDEGADEASGKTSHVDVLDQPEAGEDGDGRGTAVAHQR